MDADLCRHDFGLRARRRWGARRKNRGRPGATLGGNGSGLEGPEPQRALQRFSVRAHCGFHRILCDFGPGVLADRRPVPGYSAPDRLLTNVCRRAFFVRRGLRFVNRAVVGVRRRAMAHLPNPEIANRKSKMDWRRGWDSNPRGLSPCRFSRPEPSTTRPPFRVFLVAGKLCHRRGREQGGSSAPPLDDNVAAEPHF